MRRRLRTGGSDRWAGGYTACGQVVAFVDGLVCLGEGDINTMKLVAYPLAVLLGLLGLVFVAGAQGQWMRLAVGIVLWGATGALVWLARKKPHQTTTIVQKIDLSGDVHLESLTCRSCGGTLSKKSVTVSAGAVFVNCEYCNATYQIEEEPKW